MAIYLFEFQITALKITTSFDLKHQTRVIKLKDNQSVSVVCKRNSLKATGSQYNAATCSSGSNLKVGSQTLSYSELGCKSQPKESFVESGTCGIGGSQIEIGWQVSEEQFFNLITICHVKSQANTLYAIDTIYGAHIEVRHFKSSKKK